PNNLKLGKMSIRQFRLGFNFNDYFILNQKINSTLSNFNFIIKNWQCNFIQKRQSDFPKFNDQAPMVNQFLVTISHTLVNFHGTANYFFSYVRIFKFLFNHSV